MKLEKSSSLNALIFSSFIANFALDICDAIVDHDGVLLKSHLLLLQLPCLLFQESNFVQVILLQLAEVLFQVVDVLQNLLKDVIEAFCALMLEGCTLWAEKLRVFLIIIQLFDAFFDVYLLIVEG